MYRDDYNGLTSDIFRPFYSMSDHLYIVFLMQCIDVRKQCGYQWLLSDHF